MDALVQVRPASIPRWNEHKDVKEDKERDPCVFGPHGRNLAVDSKVSILFQISCDTKIAFI